MAAPMVSAAAAMLFSYNPQPTVQQVKDALMGSAGQRAALSGLSVTGGRLDAAAALRAIGAVDPTSAASVPEDAPVVDPDTGDSANADEPEEPDVVDDGTPTDGAPGPLTLSAVSLDGLVRLCGKECHAKPAALRFKLSAGGPVVVSLARRACPHGQQCAHRWAAKRAVKGRPASRR